MYKADYYVTNQIVKVMNPPDLKGLAGKALLRLSALMRGKAIFLLSVIIIAAAAFFYIKNQQIAEKDILDECRIANIPEMQKCFTEKLAVFAEEKGYRDALLALERAKDKRPDLYYNCHFIAHALGQAAYNHFRDISRTLEESEGINVCLAGYYHHTLIEYVQQNFSAFSSGQALAEKSCDVIATESGKRKMAFDCYHGLGHGLTVATNYDLTQALKQCDSLTNENGQFICQGGAFMQNAMLAFEHGHKDSQAANYPFFKNGNPFYPCHQVDEKYRDICYFNAVQQYFIEGPSIQTQKPQNKVDGAFALCREAPEKNRSHCFEGLGVFWGYGVGWDIKTMRESCLRGQSFDEQKSCVIGAASRYLRMGRDELIRFCNSLPPELAAPCRESAKNLYLF